MKGQDASVNEEEGMCCMACTAGHSTEGGQGDMERVDSAGNIWRCVYTGGGAHLKNWLDQFIELWGEENVLTEEIDPAGLCCYREGGEKLFRVWVLCQHHSAQYCPRHRV